MKCFLFGSLAIVLLVSGTAAHADLLYQNFTPGSTDYQTDETRNITSSLPVFSGLGFSSPGQTLEMRFRFTPTVSIVPRWAQLPIFGKKVNVHAAVHNLRVEIRDPLSDQYWWAGRAVSDIIQTEGTTEEATVYFSYNENTPPVQIGKEYEIVLTTSNGRLEEVHGYLSNQASTSAELYTAWTDYGDTTPYVESTTPLDYEAAVSIHGDFVEVPEPATAALLGLLGMVALGRRAPRTR